MCVWVGGGTVIGTHEIFKDEIGFSINVHHNLCALQINWNTSKPVQALRVVAWLIAMKENKL